MVSVCLSVTFVHCAQTAEDIGTISSAYDSPMYLTHTRSVKIWLASVNPFIPKVTHPLLIWASKTVDGKLRPNGHGGEPVGNHHRSFEWYTIADALRPPLPSKWWSQNPCKRRCLSPNYFGFYLWMCNMSTVAVGSRVQFQFIDL